MKSLFEYFIKLEQELAVQFGSGVLIEEIVVSPRAYRLLEDEAASLHRYAPPSNDYLPPKVLLLQTARGAIRFTVSKPTRRCKNCHSCGSPCGVNKNG